METKLTLKLKKKTIEKGKVFAKKRKTSLSRLIENYLNKVTTESEEIEITPLVKSLSGVIHKKVKKGDYASYLQNKYR
jgi:hypothetical protein